MSWFFGWAAARRRAAPLLLAACAASLVFGSAAARADSLAVLELRSRLPEAEGKAIDAAYLTDRVRAAALRAAPELRVMTRENVLVLLKSLGRTLEECEGECEVDTGRKLGADLVLSGEVLRYGKSVKASLRLHDTRDGRLLAASVATGAGAEELDAALPAAVQELFAARAAQAAPRSAAAVPAPPALIASPPGSGPGAAEQTVAARIGTALALEARLIAPLSANFSTDAALSEGGLFPGVFGAGLRAGGVTWLDGSFGLRWGGGLDLRLGRFSESFFASGASAPSATTEMKPLLGVLGHFGVLLPVGERWVLGASWTPGFFRRPSNSSNLGAISSVRPLSFELHADRALRDGPPTAKLLRLRLFLSVEPQVGYKDVGDDYVAYGSAGAGLAWY